MFFPWIQWIVAGYCKTCDGLCLCGFCRCPE
jgi:hypothetical protein